MNDGIEGARAYFDCLPGSAADDVTLRRERAADDGTLRAVPDQDRFTAHLETGATHHTGLVGAEVVALDDRVVARYLQTVTAERSEDIASNNVPVSTAAYVDCVATRGVRRQSIRAETNPVALDDVVAAPDVQHIAAESGPEITVEDEPADGAAVGAAVEVYGVVTNGIVEDGRGGDYDQRLARESRLGRAIDVDGIGDEGQPGIECDGLLSRADGEVDVVGTPIEIRLVDGPA